MQQSTRLLATGIVVLLLLLFLVVMSILQITSFRSDIQTIRTELIRERDSLRAYRAEMRAYTGTMKGALIPDSTKTLDDVRERSGPITEQGYE